MFFSRLEDSSAIYERKLSSNLVRYLRNDEQGAATEFLGQIFDGRAMMFFGDFFGIFGNNWQAIPYLAVTSNTVYNRTTFRQFGVNVCLWK